MKQLILLSSLLICVPIHVWTAAPNRAGAYCGTHPKKKSELLACSHVRYKAAPPSRLSALSKTAEPWVYLSDKRKQSGNNNNNDVFDGFVLVEQQPQDHQES